VSGGRAHSRPWIRAQSGPSRVTVLAYEGEPEIFKAPFKKPKGGQLTVDQQASTPYTAPRVELLHVEHDRTT
jgi:hypothetical protein